MKTSERNLRRLIREMLEDFQSPSEAMFYSILRNLSDDNGGYLPVTHETEHRNVPLIKKEGIRSMDHGIFLFVGWHKEPRWITPGQGAIIHARIPASKIRFLVPDDRYGTDGFYLFLEDYPDVEGGEVGYNADLIPPRDIVKIVTP